MIEKITYIAYDGTEFANEDECLEYEDEKYFAEFKDHVHLFDGERCPMPFSYGNFEDCFYILIDDEKALASFIATMENNGYTELPRAVGVYEYNTRRDKWMDLREKVSNLTDLIEELCSNAG